MKIIILSGLPGSGKSSFLARSNIPGIVLEADDYFWDYSRGPRYIFDPRKISDARASCMRKYLDLIHDVREDVETIAIANTNTTLWEISPYVLVAQARGIPFEVIRLDCSVETSKKRNIHHVSEESIVAMAMRLEMLLLPETWPNRRIAT